MRNEIGNIGSSMATLKLLLAIIAVAAVWTAVQTTANSQGPVVSQAMAAPPSGIPDQGLQMLDMIREQQRTNDNLVSISNNLQKLIDLLQSGKVEVQTREAGQKAPAAAAED